MFCDKLKNVLSVYIISTEVPLLRQVITIKCTICDNEIINVSVLHFQIFQVV